MSFIEMAFLAILQGVTEFLPVSSSGHLVIAQSLMDIGEPGVTLEVMLHIGTLLAVITVFRRDIAGLFLGFLSLTGLGKKHPYERLVWILILASLPAGIAGFVFYSAITSFFTNPAYTYLFLMLTGLYLILSRFASAGTVNLEGTGPLRGFIIGISQVFTMLPGISRSGTTITTGMFLGLERDTAARFSFLMSIPAVSGAALYEARNIREAGMPALLLAAGVALSFLTGILAIKLLLRVILAKKLYYFGYYCILAGIFGLLFLI